MLSQQEAEETLDKLTEHFGVDVTLIWDNRIRNGFWRPSRDEIHLGSKCWAGVSTVLHEYAHALCDKRHGRITRTVRRKFHGKEFCDCLKEISIFFYGDASKYPYQKEYKHVQAYFRKQLGIKKVRKVFCKCGFTKECSNKDVAFDLAVEHRTIHPDRPFLDTKISTEYEKVETQKQLKSSNVVNVKSGKAQKGQNMYQIDNDVPMPEVTRKGKSEKYAFSKLVEPKQSFFIPGANKKTVSHAAYSAEKRLSKGDVEVRFVVAEVTENEVAGVRVWRKDNA